MQIKIISAGAGSGKTYRLTREMVGFLTGGGVRPEGVIATTFTRKAAAELVERCRMRLLEDGLTQEADALSQALIGTVHGMGVRLLQRFAYEAGVSPAVDIIAEEDHQVLFNQALATVLTGQRVERMEALSLRFNHDPNFTDWRGQVRRLTELARANGFDADALADSGRRSWESLAAFLDPVKDPDPAPFRKELASLLESTAERLQANDDHTKKTAAAVDSLKKIGQKLALHGHLPWADWARLGKLGVGAKSRDDAAPLIAFAESHTAHPEFHAEIKAYIDTLFDLAGDALREYETFKNRRGLIDYTDMEVLVNALLDQDAVKKVLAEELDLLMVDEFQDTSPLQLEIFLKLSRLATHSVWVGDPKQSIYGFRGAEPELMQAVIRSLGGIRSEDILPYSWRSRQDIVFTTNAIFTRAFPELPPEQVSLGIPPIRQRDPLEGIAVKNWRLRYAGEGRKPGKAWTGRALAEAIRQHLDTAQTTILPKGEPRPRPLRAGDVAVLCRSNRACQQMADDLADAGLVAAIARAGLLTTAETTLTLASLRYLLNRQDSLAVAEILVLGQGWTTAQMAEHRLAFLSGTAETGWAADIPLLRRLDDLRSTAAELSSSECVDLVLDELDIRRRSVAWGQAEQRLDNLEALRRMALDYETACARLHEASSLGGFLLWLDQQAEDEKDMRAASQAPDAVQVLTYHAAKGLEWPLVVCHDLDNAFRADLWGMAIASDREDVDLDNVLGHRWIRFWVNPYGAQENNTPLRQRMMESPAYAAIEAQARQEEKRLLYVGLTRARDFLVFANGLKGTPWLNRVCHDDPKQPVLPESDGDPAFFWQEEPLPLDSETFSFDHAFPSRDRVEPAQAFWEERAGRASHPPLLIDPLAEGPFLPAECRVEPAYAPPLPEVAPDAEREAGQMLRAYFAALDPAQSSGQARQAAADHLARFLPNETWPPRTLAQTGLAFFAHLAQRAPHRRLRRHYPVRASFGNRRFEAWADLVLESEDHLLLVQHSLQTGAPEALQRHARKLAPWLHYLSSTAEAALDKPVRQVYLHFLWERRLVTVAFPSAGG